MRDLVTWLPSQMFTLLVVLPIGLAQRMFHRATPVFQRLSAKNQTVKVRSRIYYKNTQCIHAVNLAKAETLP